MRESFATILASGVCIASAAALLGLTLVERLRIRVVATCVVLAGTLGVMFVQLFRPHAMGDYSVYARNRDYFDERFGHVMQFQYHLGGALVRGFDAAYGRTAQSPGEAFHTLARLGSLLFVAGLAVLALLHRFSPQVLRYLALAVAVPPTLLLFGYHEFGYLPEALSAVAIPLALVGLERDRNDLVLVGAVLIGVGAALHGFGLVAAVFLLLVTLVWERNDVRRLASRVVQIVGGVSFGWLSWLVLYFTVFDWSVSPGNADLLPLRPLFHTYADRPLDRYNYAVFSSTGLRDILFEFIILGVFVSAFILYCTRGGRLWQAIAIASVPVTFFVIFFWPVQGLGNDTDFLGSAFPSFYGAGWLASRSWRLTVAAVVLLALSQAAMLYVVHGFRFVHSQDF